MTSPPDLGSLPASVALPDEDATLALGAALAACLEPGAVVGLRGPLGAGKTLLVRGACVALGVEAREVTSPTYTLVHYYEGRLPVVHADLYRLERRAAHPDEIGLAEELLGGSSVLFLEWPEPLGEYLPEDTWWVTLGPGPEGGRRARVSRGPAPPPSDEA